MVSDFLIDEIIPDLTVSLLNSKQAILNAAILGAEKMAERLAQSMCDRLAENLGSPYERKKILETLFG